MIHSAKKKTQNIEIGVQKLLKPAKRLIFASHWTGIIGSNYSLDYIKTDHWIRDNVVFPIKQKIMPAILKTLEKKPWLLVVFLGCGYTIHYPMGALLRSHSENKQLFQRHYCDQYSAFKQMLFRPILYLIVANKFEPAV